MLLVITTNTHWPNSLHSLNLKALTVSILNVTWTDINVLKDTQIALIYTNLYISNY